MPTSNHSEYTSDVNDTLEYADFTVALNSDVIPIILSFLSWKDILSARICRKWKEAAKLADVPETFISTRESSIRGKKKQPELYIRDREFACALQWISDALPKIPTVNFGSRDVYKIAKGENLDVRLVPEREYLNIPPLPSMPPPVDISPIANFRNLRHLIMEHVGLNGSYPFLFNFPQLRTLNLNEVNAVEWDLEQLRGLPKLERLKCVRNYRLTGSLKSVRVIQKSLVELNLLSCDQIEGDLSDISDFPRLEELNLFQTEITGDLRNIGPDDLESITFLGLGDSVIGGTMIPSIQDAPAVMLARSYLERRDPGLFRCSGRLRLPFDAPERYRFRGHHAREPPFCVKFVQAGNRLGWRWTNCVRGGSCETNWLDPAPDPSDDGYDTYIEELERVENDVDFFKGFFSPPTENEHNQRNADIPLDPILVMYSTRF